MDKEFLLRAIEKANESVANGGFPAGAIIVKNDQIIGEGISIGNKLDDPTAHGESVAIRNACQNLSTTDLSGATLYASMQPCVMCLGAAMWSNISKIVFACPMNKVDESYYGGHYDLIEINSNFTHPIEIAHLDSLENDSLAVVRNWEKALNI